MFSVRIAYTLSLALLAMAPLAHAQQYGRDGDVVCESQDNRTRECRTPFRNAALAETLSNAACIEGRTWGSRGPGNVWVTDGCRARFVEARGGGRPGSSNNQAVVRCESNNGRTQECAIPRGARMAISRQLSDTRCVEGRNWGNRQNRVWVSDGCRADFVAVSGWGSAQGGGFGQSYEQGREITCASEDHRDNSCTWNARWGHPQLLEQLSDVSCREGYTWGYDGRSRIWVTRGCRGRFGR
jgi:hypothetical protein